MQKEFTNLDHILTLRAHIEERTAHNKRIYCCFVYFRKVFDTVQRARLMKRTKAVGVPIDMQGGIYALYESVSCQMMTHYQTISTHRRMDSSVGREWNLKNTISHCSVFYEIRGRYHCIFNQHFGHNGI